MDRRIVEPRHHAGAFKEYPQREEHEDIERCHVVHGVNGVHADVAMKQHLRQDGVG